MKFRDHPRLPGLEFEPSSKTQITKQERLAALRLPPKPPTAIERAKKYVISFASWARRWWKRIITAFLALGAMLALAVWEEIRHELGITVWHYLKEHVLPSKKPAPVLAEPWDTHFEDNRK